MAAPDPTGPLFAVPGTYLIGAGRIVYVDDVDLDYAYITYIGGDGQRLTDRILADRILGDYIAYVPCRWALECLNQATVTIDVATGKAGRVDACDDHAADHQAWAAELRARINAGRVLLTPHPEPTPECWCPTRPRRVASYCPTHGRFPDRGIDLTKFPIPSKTTLENAK